MQQRRWMIMTSAALAAAIFVGACGDDDDGPSATGDAPDAASGGDSADVDTVPEDLTADIDAGDVDAKLPESFPVWAVYLPQDFSLVDAQEREAAGRPNWVLLGGVPDDPGSVEFELLSHYGDADEHTNTENVITMTWLDDGGYTIDFTLEEAADGEASVTISILER